jgi:phosphoribosylanthranilate isomerase
MKNKTKLKICGNSQSHDIRCINKIKPTFAGFIFYSSSKRYVSLNKAVKLLKKLDNNIASVGIFVNTSIKEIVNTSIKCKLDILQLHGGESLKFVYKLKKRLKYICHKTKKQNTHTQIQHKYNTNIQKPKTKKIKIIKVFSIKKDTNISKLKQDIKHFSLVCDYFLFDTFVSQYGGVGKTFNWNIINELKKIIKQTKKPYFIAGGINEFNIKQALSVESDFIDIASGVENNNYSKNGRKIARVFRVMHNFNK